MKHSPDTYARAFLNALDETPRSKRGILAKRLAAAIRRNGDLAKAEKITSAVEQALVAKAGGRWVRVEVARALDTASLAGVTRNFERRDRIEITARPALIAGVRITVDGERELDSTLQRKLKRMFAHEPLATSG